MKFSRKSHIFPFLKSNSTSLILGLFGSLEKRRKYQLLLLLVLMIMAALSEVFSLVSFIPFITSLSNPEKILESDFLFQKYPSIISFFDNNFVLIFTIVFSISIILAGLLRILNVFYTYRLTAKIGTDFLSRCLDRIYYQPYTNFINRNSSETVHLSVVQVKDAINVILFSLQILTSTILFFSLIVTMLLINFKLTLVAILLFVSIYVFLILKFKSRLYSYSKEVDYIRKSQIQLLTEMNGSIRDIILSNSQGKFLSLLISQDIIMRRKESNSYFLNSFPKPVIESFALFLFAIFGSILYSSPSNTLVIPIVGSLALASQKLIPALQSIYSSWAIIKTYIAGAKSVSKVLLSPQIKINQYTKKYKHWKSIKFSKVSFSHKNLSKKIISNMNLTINRGDTLGIQGITGSGKSTFADLLSGLLLPTNGSIDVVTDINQRKGLFNDPSWFKEVAYVPQKIFLLDTSVAKNIAFTMEESEIDYELLVKVSKMAKIHEHIETLKKGYDTNVGEQGIILSGGQQQRIGIARALYRKASLLIFDEATSALDYDTEDQIMESISYLSELDSITIIFIAHRLNTLELCNSIYKIDKGKFIKRK